MQAALSPNNALISVTCKGFVIQESKIGIPSFAYKNNSAGYNPASVIFTELIANR